MINEDSYIDASYEDRTELIDPPEDFACEPISEVDSEDHNPGWPGDGSGEDDLADYNAAEADDYMHE
jgi:hypothetical protein